MNATRSALILAVIAVLLLLAARPAHAQTETVLYNFCSVESQGDCLDGANPRSSLTSSGGNFYGTTFYGGAGYSPLGTVFELSPNGSGGWNETVLYNFCSFVVGDVCTDGSYPSGPVVFDSLGNLYGTTPGGGSSNCGITEGCGVVFELSPAAGSWTESLPYTFCLQGSCSQTGAFPGSDLIVDRAGNLYGTDDDGVFELSPSGGAWTFQVISHGAENPASGLAMDAAGDFFVLSAITGKWTVFEVSPNGKGGWNTTSIYSFTSSPRTVIWGALALDQAGNIYDTETAWYNVKRKPLNFRGTVFKLSPGESGWTKKVFFTFTPDGSSTEGNAPSGGLVLDAAGNLYGTTIQGGTYGLGTVFELAPGAKGKYQERVLWNFNGTDGSAPLGSLILDSAGNLYGTTSEGGANGNGVVFEVTP